jgi:membrane dipeptidase
LGLQRPRVSLESVADQFEYVKELVGTDVLAIGSDYDGIRETPPGLEGPDKLPALLEALAGRGFSPKQIVDISCRNVLRYLGWQ